MKKNFLIFSALALGLTPLTVPVKADSAMSGMDMSGAKTPQKPMAASLSVMASINPTAPKSGDNTLDLLITDAASKPVKGLKLTSSVAMTSMDMGTTHATFTDAGNGHYKATVTFSMEGPWRVVVRGQGTKIAVLDFEPGSKTPWKSPQIKAALGASSAAPAPTAKPPVADSMAGMDMSGSKDSGKVDAAKPDAMAGMDMSSQKTAPSGNMAGMDMSGKDGGMTDMKMGIADMKTAVIPELKETGTYVATGDENWKMQAGFGHNAGMVGMMNKMMVGGSGSEGMKMAPMSMKFDEKNYAKPEGDDAAGADDMAGMDMSGGKGAAKSDAAKPDAMAGMDMSGKDKGMKMDAPAPASPSPAAPASAPPAVAATINAPKAGDNALQITVTDAQDKPVAGAKITTTVAMTSMDMGTTHPAVKDMGNGKYAATVNFGMAGPWRVKVKAALPGQTPVVKAFDFDAK